MNSKGSVWIYLCCFYIYMQRNEGAYNYTLEEELRTLIFTTNSYNRFVPPDTTVKVNASLSLYTMNALEIKDESMETSVYIGMVGAAKPIMKSLYGLNIDISQDTKEITALPITFCFDAFLVATRICLYRVANRATSQWIGQWDDPRFKWSDKAEYSSIPSIRSNNEHVWVPKIAIANSVSDLSVLSDKQMFVIAFPSGTMSWINGKIDVTHCDCDVTYYPFDTQKCEIILMILGYTSAEMEINFTSSPVDTTFFSENGEWAYLGYETKIDDRTMQTSVMVRQLKFQFTFRRRPLFQFINSLLPVTLLSCLTCLLFKLPADSGEKVGFCLTVLLAFAVYVTIISDSIPTSSLTTSYLSLYLILILSMGVVSAFVTIFVLECHHYDSNKPIPIWLRQVTKNVLMPLACRQKAVCCGGCKCFRPSKVLEIQENYEHENKKCSKRSPEELTWKEIAQMIDSFAFITMLFLNTFLAITTYSVLLYGYTKP